jgi:hypothetical protein
MSAPSPPAQDTASDVPVVPAASAAEVATPPAPVAAPVAAPETTAHDASAAAAATLEAENIIEPAADDESDAGYGTSIGSGASTSLASSVRNYAFENGRRYHKFREGAYQFPNDEPEQEREDMKHAMITNLCGGKLHFAPLEDVQNILDVGTGTGIWCIDSE